MTPEAILAAVAAVGGTLTFDGHRLRCRAPQGTLTPDLRDAIRAHQSALIAAVGGAAQAPDGNPAATAGAGTASTPVPTPDIGPWNLEQTVANILAMTPGDLATYRQALAHDAEALRQAEADRALAVGQHDDARLTAALSIFDGEIVERGPDGAWVPVEGAQSA